MDINLDNINDPEFLKAREDAKIRAAAKKGIKRVKATETVAVKEATAFGAVNKKFATVEREIIETTEDEKSKKIKAELDAQLESGIFSAPVIAPDGETVKLAEGETLPNGMVVAAKPNAEQIENIKAMRDQLSGLFSVGAAPSTGAEHDHLIDGCDTGDEGAVKNPDSGDSGVRIKFRKKK